MRSLTKSVMLLITHKPLYSQALIINKARCAFALKVALAPKVDLEWINLLKNSSSDR